MTNTVDVVRRFYREIRNEGRLAAIPETCHRELIFGGSLGDEKRGSGGLSDYLRNVRGAIGPCRCEIEEIVADRQRVFARMRLSGVHTGNVLGYPATGAEVRRAGAALSHTEEGRVADLRVLGDRHGLHARLDADTRPQPGPNE